MEKKNKAPWPQRYALPLLAVAAAASVLAVLWPTDRPGERSAPAGPAQRDTERVVLPDAAGDPAEPAAGGPGRLPAISDLELALEAALAEQRTAEDAVRSAEAALFDVEEQLDLRVEQGEAPDDLEAEAEILLEGVFNGMQDALRRLDQADASVEMLEEELALARGERGARN